jgi:deoxyribodipyrimidine photolyase
LQSLPALLDKMAQATHTQLRQVMQEVKTTVEANTGRPKLALVESPSSKSGENIETNEFNKGAFVRSCLTEYPTIRNSEIQRKASELGHTISPGYISDIRKAFLEEQTA